MAFPRSSIRLAGGLAAAAWLGLGIGLEAGEPPSPRVACKSVSELLANRTGTAPAPNQAVIPASQTIGSDLPPLPPRTEAAARPVAASDSALVDGTEAAAELEEVDEPVGRATLAVLGDRELEHRLPPGSASVPLPPRAAGSSPVRPGPRPGGTSGRPAATMEIELVVTPRPGPEQPADPGAPEAALQSDSMAADGVATMESHSRGPGRGSEVQPLQDTWVFPSTAVFDGVSVPLSELAPRVLAGESDAQLARTYALLGESLAPSTLGDGPGGQPESAGQSESVLLDSSEYMPGPQEGTLTPQRVRQISSAASDLHKPLRTISMTGHLALQDPPDLASVIVPSTPERLVWGEPWPADALRFYRYTVPFSNRPLYFEQPNLERCGLHCGIITPYTSAAHFFGSAVLLPLHMVLDPPCICVPTLGDCPSCSSYGLCPHCNLMR